MSQISGPVSSIAQAALSQKDQAQRQDATGEASSRALDRQQRLKNANREFVETMTETAGLKVNPDSSHDAEARRRKRFSMMSQGDGAADSAGAADPNDEETRAHAAALLSDPAHKDGPTPPPCMIDVKA
jgi:hypothetical protein